MAINKNIKRILSMVCAGVLSITALPGMTLDVDAAPKSQIDDGYELVTESEDYALYLYEDTLSVIVEDKATGKLMRSTVSDEDNDGKQNSTWNAYIQSGIVLSMIQNGNEIQADLVNSASTITYSYNDNGFAAKIDFPAYGFGLEVDVSLVGNQLVVTVPDSSIYEEQENTYIGSVSLFPMFGYTYLDDQDGYMFLPDGNGALVYLNDKEGRYTTGFSQPIYGDDVGFYGTGSETENLLMDRYETVNDSEQIIAPIFGMAHLDDEFAYLAIVSSGESRAYIECQPNGSMIDYNRCFARFILRRKYYQPTSASETSDSMETIESERIHHDLQVEYLLLSGEDANYSGMANTYREYLLENELVTSKNTTYQTRVDFLGTEREEFLISTRAVVMTTIEDVDNIFEDLQRAGVQSLLSVYKGWQKGGLYNVPISSYKVDSKIGSEKELSTLISDAAGDGYYLYLYDDALKLNPAETSSTFNVVKQINKRRYDETQHNNVYNTFNYLIPSRSTTLLNKLITSTSKSKVNNIALAGVTNVLYSYNYSSVNYTRDDVLNAYDALVENASNASNLILEQPFMYLWKYADGYLDMPLGSSNYMYEDVSIPFLSMVLKGIIPMYSRYINFEANKTEFFLQMVESGVYPSFYVTEQDSADLIYTNSAGLYSTKYEVYKDQIVSYNTELKAVADKVNGSYIIKHEILDNGLTVVSYDNGVKIYINYSNNAVTMDGLTINALSYKVGD